MNGHVMKTKMLRHRPSLFSLLAIIFSLVSAARADIIYLKNGRKIEATNTARKNGKVTFETPAGTMALSEALVDRIVKDDTGTPQAGSNSAAAELSMTPPASTAADSALALRSIVRNGAIDEDALAQIAASASTRFPGSHGSSGGGRSRPRASLSLAEITSVPPFNMPNAP